MTRDIKFLKKRITEQMAYIAEVLVSDRSNYRKAELIDSATQIQRYFSQLLSIEEEKMSFRIEFHDQMNNELILAILGKKEIEWSMKAGFCKLPEQMELIEEQAFRNGNLETLADCKEGCYADQGIYNEKQLNERIAAALQNHIQS